MKFLGLLLIFMNFEVMALTMDCREADRPGSGYLISVIDDSTRLQSIEDDSPIGPIWQGELRPTYEHFLYIIQVETSQDLKEGTFEIWIFKPELDSPFFEAEANYFGPVFNESPYSSFKRSLKCRVHGETSPQIFRSFI